MAAGALCLLHLDNPVRAPTLSLAARDWVAHLHTYRFTTVENLAPHSGEACQDCPRGVLSRVRTGSVDAEAGDVARGVPTTLVA
ncbi:hypothetical protein [Actinoalloteichus fjordicus]|uniref:Uncharacterized protein n=1 Tax=Actinoalloteichus fjordicus TaxID=1612552 RepID=A0AAC9LFE7_9PSEU|nr:hypothetical protein [Actinoalloteichus fjordicus]APU15224.1 hypothetical protein UA74_15860 [Actinoalloteichus fjordicus]